MIVLPLQYDSHRGPDAIGQHKITFTLDESINAGEFNPMSIQKGKQFLVMMVEADSDEEMAFASETPEDTKLRFSRQMHASIQEIAVLSNSTAVIVKDELRAKLINEGTIKKSTTELNINQLATVIIRLKKYKNEIERKNASQ